MDDISLAVRESHVRQTGASMRFQDTTGQSVELTLRGFEPGAHKWIVVDGSVNDGRRGWRFSEPCLARRDVPRLANWFDEVADGRTKRRDFEFLEPNLLFEWVGEAGSRLVMRVAFELESRPPLERPRQERRRMACCGACVRDVSH